MPKYAAYIRVELSDVANFYQAEHAAEVLAACLPRHALVETNPYSTKSTPVGSVAVDSITIISNK